MVAAWLHEESKTWTRWLYISATYTFPEPSTATLSGEESWPSPEPLLPIVAAWLRDESNTWTRPCGMSATYTFPAPSAAIPAPKNKSNWPSPEPRPPKAAVRFREESSARMRWFSMSATYTIPEPSTAMPATCVDRPSPGSYDKVATCCSANRRSRTEPEEATMSDASRVEAFMGSPNPTVNCTARRSPWPTCAVAIAGTGGVPSYSMLNSSASALGLPAASRAAPAGMSTSIAPLAEGETSNAYEAPAPEKLTTPPWDAVPESATSPAPNPVTFSPNSTVNPIVDALVGLDRAAATAGARSVRLVPMLAVLDSAFAFPALSSTRPAGILTVRFCPSAGSATSKAYAGSYTCTRWVPLSATYILPVEPSTAKPSWWANWPLPGPWEPMVAAWFHEGSNTWTRSLTASATYTFPAPSTATPSGL